MGRTAIPVYMCLAVLQVGKPVKCQGNAGEEATLPLQKNGSVALLGSVKRYIAKASPPHEYPSYKLQLGIQYTLK